MQQLLQDPLVALIEGRMHESIAAGGDVAELAAVAVDATVAECIALLEVRAAQERDSQTRAVILQCAEALLGAQFSGWAPALTRR
jgi:hypothetical protein